MAAPASPATAPGERAMRRNIQRFYVFQFFVHFQLWLPIWAVYLLDERGLSLFLLGAFDAPFWILWILLEVPTGAVADRWGRKVSLSYGAAVYAIAVTVFGLAGNLPVLLASYIIFAVAFTLFSGADAAFVYDSLRGGGRERDYQRIWGRMEGVSYAGGILGLLLGAPLAHFTTLSVPIVASGALGAVAWLVTLTFREPPRLDTGERQQSYLKGVREAFGIAFSRPPVRAMLLLSAAVMGVGTSVVFLEQPFLRDHGVPVAFFGLLLTPGQLVAIAAAVLSYRATRALGLTRMVLFMPLPVLVTAAGLGLIDHVAAFAFYPITTAGLALIFPLVSDYLNRRIPSSHRATVLSIHQMIFSVIIAVVEVLVLWVGDEFGLPAAYRVAVAIMILLAVPLFAIWLREHRREVLPPEEEEDAPAESADAVAATPPPGPGGMG